MTTKKLLVMLKQDFPGMKLILVCDTPLTALCYHSK